VLHRSAAPLPGSARTHTALKNTPENVVRMCRSAVSLIGGARNTHGIKNTRGFVKMCTFLVFLYQAVQGTNTA